MSRAFLVCFSLILTQCASFEKTVGLGVGLGAATGFTAAHVVNYNAKGTAFLGIAGALVGGVIGALLHRDRATDSPPPEAVSVLKDNPPPLKNAEKDVLWMPDRIEGDRFEEGHRIFTIKKPAHWQLRDQNGEDETEAPNDEQ